eukprot:3580799-Pleurochrysis_carterae.AAC.1
MSLNTASRAHHLPEHFLADTRPDFLAWLHVKDLPRTPAQQLSDGSQRSKWPRERKPTLAHAMRDLAILRAAADSLGEPVYVVGDDAADYFNQLAMVPEEWWKLGIVFLRDGEDLCNRPQIADDSGNTLFF